MKLKNLAWRSQQFKFGNRDFYHGVMMERALRDTAFKLVREMPSYRHYVREHLTRV